MLLCTLGTGPVHLLLDTGYVVGIEPSDRLQSGTNLDGAMVGTVQHRERILPVYDLGLLLLDKPTRDTVGTRIVLVRETVTGEPLFGVRAEYVTALLKTSDESFSAGSFLVRGVTWNLPTILYRGAVAYLITPEILRVQRGSTRAIAEEYHAP